MIWDTSILGNPQLRLKEICCSTHVHTIVKTVGETWGDRTAAVLAVTRETSPTDPCIPPRRYPTQGSNIKKLLDDAKKKLDQFFANGLFQI